MLVTGTDLPGFNLGLDVLILGKEASRIDLTLLAVDHRALVWGLVREHLLRLEVDIDIEHVVRSTHGQFAVHHVAATNERWLS